MVTTPNTASYAFVAEQNNPYLELFPHRYDFIWAERPAPGQRPAWQTESRYPLSDRQVLQGQYLYGVRFGSQTQYLMIDVDVSSPYHPKHDRLAIARLVEALEPIGLVSFLPCTSSYSGGLHLYFPLDRSYKTWDLAFAVQTLLQRTGFKVSPGSLELFPNPKLYVQNEPPNLYAAHRLPLQEPGSYLLTADWSPRFTSQLELVRSWKQVANRNELQVEMLQKTVAQARRFQQGLSQPASKFLDDLNTEIENGWTGHGQTNRLLGRIAMRSYIFGHFLNGLSFPLEGAQLVNDIVRVACQLPGYREWCCHQHEIEDRAEEWARCAENSHYFPYGHSKNQISLARLSEQSPAEISWNQKQESDARSRIARAIAKLFEGNRLPTSTTARFHLLVQEGIGGGTLYRHRDLWHPKYLQQQLATYDSIPSEIEEEHFEQQNFDFPTAIKAGSQSKNDYDPALKSLLEADGRNPIFLKSSSDLEHQLLGPGCNVYDDCLHVRGSVPVVEQTTLIQKQRSQWQEAYRDRMQRYLVSGDAILMAEAQAWFVQFDASESLSASDRASKKAKDIQSDLPMSAKPSSELLRVKTVETLEKIPIQKNQTNCLDRPITRQEQFQGVVQAIAYHLARLNWTAPTLRHYLLICIGKPLQALLTDVELVRWLQFLESI